MNRDYYLVILDPILSFHTLEVSNTDLQKYTELEGFPYQPLALVARYSQQVGRDGAWSEYVLNIT